MTPTTDTQSPFIKLLQQYRDAAYPLLYVQTHEEVRLIDELSTLETEGAPIYIWASTTGFRKLGDDTWADKETTVNKVLEKIISFPESSLVVMKDFKGSLGNGTVIRLIRDMLPHLEAKGKGLLIVDPVVTIPVELEKDIQLVPFQLPGRPEIEAIFNKLVSEQEARSEKVDISARVPMLTAASGGTANEARNWFALAYGKYGKFNTDAARTVLNEKAQSLKKAGILEWREPVLDISKLGGLGNVKAYLEMISPIFWNPDEALAYGLKPEDFPRSIMFVGPAGTGKSLAAQILANVLRVGCVRTDFGKIFSAGGGRSGAAEGNVEYRNQQVEAMAPVVDWWDEAEKGLQGGKGKSEANPWEARVAGSLLTWFEMFRAQVLVAATVNRQEMIAVEMLSRFQKVFFVDLPTKSERVEILTIMAGERPIIKLNAADLASLAAEMDQFSGREIRDSIQLACQMGFNKRAKTVGGELIQAALRTKRPVAKTRPEETEALRKWAKDNDIEWASNAEDNTNIPSTRKIRVR